MNEFLKSESVIFAGIIAKECFLNFKMQDCRMKNAKRANVRNRKTG
ncbi:hypothetical protein RO1_21120 [Roseburia intestinalis XB6B4]|uniref:Uncharacterized protein n=1 Tax=Roseburia intestinalis XB6B4 TaxID=718255 RepID=D4KZ50_9FIRM|nr:hypothetical protein RO1_21120 [Roseburia intestinalis XB6B4]